MRYGGETIQTGELEFMKGTFGKSCMKFNGFRKRILAYFSWKMQNTKEQK
jgi:hypothetical protein